MSEAKSASSSNLNRTAIENLKSLISTDDQLSDTWKELVLTMIADGVVPASIDTLEKEFEDADH